MTRRKLNTCAGCGQTFPPSRDEGKTRARQARAVLDESPEA